MSDNVVEFPKNKKDAIQAQLDKLKQAHDTVQQLNKTRKESLEKLAKRVELLDENREVNAENLRGVTEAVRDLRTAMGHVFDATDAHDQMIDMITNDLISFIQNFEQHSVAFYQSSIMLQALGMLMVDKGVLSVEEVETKQKEILQQLRSAKQNAKATEPEEGGPEG